MSSAEADRLARVSLSVAVEPGSVRMLALVCDVGAEVVCERLQADPQTAARFEGLDPARVLADATRRGLRFVTPSDEEWPVQLSDLARAPALQERGGVPVGLWVRGRTRLDQLVGSVAVVGSRSATTYGAEVAAAIAADVTRSGAVVVSGGAYGIDQAAHRGAVAAGGPTVAVLACGADRTYPAGLHAMIDHIAIEGAVVSETPPGGAPMRVRFLSRNRLIAALTGATVVVEAAVRSGALNTANWAGRLNRHLMGVPGPVTSASSQGVHQLVRSGAATLVTGGADVLELVSAAGERLAPELRGPERVRDRLTHGQLQVLDAVPVSVSVGVESIARTAGRGLDEVQACLLALRDLGLVADHGTGWRLAALAHR